MSISLILIQSSESILSNIVFINYQSTIFIRFLSISHFKIGWIEYSLVPIPIQIISDSIGSLFSQIFNIF